MQAYQSPPCAYCGATWNQPRAQSCASCNNPLPPQPGYAPPVYRNYPSPDYPQQPHAPGPTPGYQGQSVYPNYSPPGSPQQPEGSGRNQGYRTYVPGATANARGTTLQLFGKTVTLPVALPPRVVRSASAIVGIAIGLVVAVVLSAAVLPTVAAGQISSADQALATAAGHQPRVDAGFAALFAPDPGTNDLNIIQAQAVKDAQSVNDALMIVRGDEAAIDGANLRLMVLQWVAPQSRAAIAKERMRLATARPGLSQADTALTAGANQAKVLLPLYEAMIDFSKMFTAMAKRDLARAAAPYPEAHKKVALALSLDHEPGVPESVAKVASAVNNVLDNFERLVQAVQSKDAAGTKKYSDAVEAGLKTMSALPKTIPADYQVKTYGGMQKLFDAVMMSVKGGS